MRECPGLDKKAYEVMSSPVVSVRSWESLEDAARAMYSSNVGSVVVVDEDGRLAGIVTRKDVLYLVAVGEAKRNPRVSTIMSSSVITARENDTLGVILSRMTEAGIKHVVIIDEDERPVGVVSMWDILMAIAGECLPQPQ